MANARIVLDEAGARSHPSLVRLTLLALLLALAFDAVSTALAWSVVRALPGTSKRSPVHAVRPGDVREPGRQLGLDGQDTDSSSP
jgi:hypothetical protein